MTLLRTPSLPPFPRCSLESQATLSPAPHNLPNFRGLSSREDRKVPFCLWASRDSPKSGEMLWTHTSPFGDLFPRTP